MVSARLDLVKVCRDPFGMLWVCRFLIGVGNISIISKNRSHLLKAIRCLFGLSDFEIYVRENFQYPDCQLSFGEALVFHSVEQLYQCCFGNK